MIRDAQGGSEPDAGQMVRWAGETVPMRDFLAGAAAVPVETPRPLHLDGRSTSWHAAAHGIIGRSPSKKHSAPGDSGRARRARMAS